jgi:flagellar basal body rod protein FlgF
MEPAMHVSYIKVYRDSNGLVHDEQSANGEFRNLHHQVSLLKNALEIEMQAVADLRELLDSARRMALELNEQLTRGND